MKKTTLSKRNLRITSTIKRRATIINFYSKGVFNYISSNIDHTKVVLVFPADKHLTNPSFEMCEKLFTNTAGNANPKGNFKINANEFLILFSVVETTTREGFKSRTTEQLYTNCICMQKLY